MSEFDSRKVLNILQTNPVDLCVLDINMPHLNGIELCRQIKQDEKLAHIPVIFLTATGELDVLMEAFSAGAIDFLTKPVNLTELILRVESHIHLHQLKSELIEQNISLNHKIQELSKQLSESQRMIERNFQERELGFQGNSKSFEETRQKIAEHSERIERFNQMLKQQEDLVKQTKSKMGL